MPCWPTATQSRAVGQEIPAQAHSTLSEEVPRGNPSLPAQSRSKPRARPSRAPQRAPNAVLEAARAPRVTPCSAALYTPAPWPGPIEQPESTHHHARPSSWLVSAVGASAAAATGTWRACRARALLGMPPGRETAYAIGVPTDRILRHPASTLRHINQAIACISTHIAMLASCSRGALAPPAQPLLIVRACRPVSPRFRPLPPP